MRVHALFVVVLLISGCPQPPTDCQTACSGLVIPAPQCLDGETAGTFTLDTTQCEGRCDVITARERCVFGCRDGRCQPQQMTTMDSGVPDAGTSEDAGTTSDAGTDAGMDSCMGLTCVTPPSKVCVDATRLQIFEVPGVCSAGQCQYTSREETCTSSCANGSCTNNPCQGVTCAMPPANVCDDAMTLRAYSTSGTCSAGTCSYTSQPVTCQFGCAAGLCVNDPCAGVTCAQPPAAFCVSTTTLRSHAPAGTCNQGTCVYAPTDTTCAFGCSNGACLNDPCAGVSCTTPPANSCLDSTRLRSWGNPGTCANGSCAYSPTDTTCAFGCTNGACQGDPCAGILCTVPPANACVGADSIRTWTTPGTCSSTNGTCSYTPMVSMCPAGPAPTCADASTRRTFTAACTAGVCGATPTDTACPPAAAPTCADAFTRRTFTASCTGGVCGSTSSDTSCPGGCSAGACVPVVCTRGATRPCSSECFCEENLIDDETLTDILALSPTNIWVSGTRGSLVHFDGGTWAKSPPLTTSTIHSLTATTSGAIWAVGANGTVLRNSGGVWSSIDAGTGETLRGVDGTETYLWAVGERGTIAYWNGTTWSVRSAGTDVAFADVSVGSDVAIVGARGGTPVIYTANSASITPSTVPAGASALTGIAPDTGGHSAVGFSGTILNRSGSTWTKITAPATASTAYLARIRDNWVVGGRTLSGSGTVWNDQSSNVGSSWSSVSSVPFGAGGTYFCDGTRVSRWYQSTLTALTPQVLDFSGVWGSSTNQVWMVGEDSQVRGGIRLWDGQRVVTRGVVGLWGNDPLNAVWGSAANDVYAVGVDATILRFDGTTWNVVQYSPASFTAWVAVHGSSASNVWVAGYERLRRFDGATWVTETLAGFGVINGVWTFGPTSGWVVGATARRRTASGWSVVATGTTSELTTVWASDVNDVWVGGNSGFVARWNGSSFTTFPIGTSATVRNITGRSANDVFISGVGFVKHWDGTRLRDVAIGTSATRAITGAWAGAGGETWFVGDSGIARRKAQ